MSELLKAVKRGDLIEIKKLIESHAFLNEKNSQGWTALFKAAEKGDVKTLKILIDAGADVNHGDKTGFTALFAAVLSGHVDAVKILLESGASATIKVQVTSLTKLAMGIKKDAIIQLLRKAGAE